MTSSFPTEAGFAEAALTEDGFLGGRVRLLQPRHGYRAATDPVFLAAAVPARAGESVLDLGCGAGAALFCLGVRVPGLRLAGLEQQPGYAALARRNAVLNGLPAEILAGDVAAPPAALRARSFDHVLSNPPFFAAGSGTAAADAGRARAHGEGPAGLDAFIDLGLRRLRPGGSLTLIHRTERLGDILAALAGRAGDIRVLPLAPRAGRPAGRVIVRARKGRATPLTLLPPLPVHAGARHAADAPDYSDAAAAVLARGAALALGG
ncbi:methyltransferase [Rhodobacteraceae bacterium 2CG4]|uniref:Methyltransferase n=1 Tax=Halovulum marinum TaxID=2662447 RepID=A0A6L5YV94_9RHOB|nr:methyltransferase [Halovulum marinum]MSU88188.1 methyltransferase [Halovulum marinum]